VGAAFTITATEAEVLPQELVAVTVYVPAVFMTIEFDVTPFDHSSEPTEFVFKRTLSPTQNEVGPEGIMETAGAANEVTSRMASELPQLFVTVSVYEPPELILIVDDVAPVDHRYVPAPEACNVSWPPLQTERAVFGKIAAVGGVFTLMV
jgi:hypothetical protein